MMEKVKLTQEQSYAIEQLRTYDFEDVLIMRRRKDMPYLYSSLDSLTVDELGSIFFNPDSYGVEEKYKVGDWVAFIKLLGDHIISKVENVSQEKVNTDHVASNGYKQSFDKENIRHATPEEIKAEKERRVWAEIGREVGEIKEGDVGVCKGGNTWSMLSHIKNRYRNDDLKGLYPTESLIKFGGDSDD